MQLALVGSMAHDDPKAGTSTTRPSRTRRRPGHLHPLQPQQRRLGGGQRVPGALGAVIQKSIREGFGLTVTEALWKTRPTVAGPRRRDRRADPRRRDGLARRLVDGVRGGVPRDPRDPEAARAAGAARQGVRAATLPDAAAAPRLARAVQPADRQRHSAPSVTVVAAAGGATCVRETDRRLEPRARVLRPRTRGDAHREAGRRRTCDGAPQPRAAPRRHLDRERDHGRGPRRRRRGIRGDSRDGSPYRVRLVAHDPQAYDWYYNVVANPMLWFVQHHLWDLAVHARGRPAFHHAWQDGYAASTRLRGRGGRRSSPARPTPPSSSTTITCTSRRGSCASARPDARTHALRPRSLAAARLLARASRGHAERDPRRADRERRRRVPHRPLAPQLHLQRARDCSARTSLRRRSPARRRSRARSRRPASSTSWRSSDAVLSAERELVASRAREADRASRPHRPLEEHRARLPRVRAYLDAHPELHRRVGMLALLDPSRQDIPEYADISARSSERRAASTIAFSKSGWRPIDLQIGDNFPHSVAAYKQFDVLLVNAIFDGMNLVAKEAPLVNERDGVVVLSENAGAHAELGEWALTVNPFDVEGQAEAIGRGARDGPGRAAARARRDSRAGARARS